MQEDIKPAAYTGIKGGKTAIEYARRRREQARNAINQDLDDHPAFWKYRDAEKGTGTTGALRNVAEYAAACQSRGPMPAAPGKRAKTAGSRSKIGAQTVLWQPDMLIPPANGKHFTFFEFCHLWHGTSKAHRADCMLYLQGDANSKCIVKKREPTTPKKPSAAVGRCKNWRDNNQPDTLAALAELPGIACVAHQGWGRGKTGRPAIERVEESDRVTENHGNRRGATNGEVGTGERLTIGKKKNLESAGRSPTDEQCRPNRQTIINYHVLQTSGEEAHVVKKAVDNTGPR